ncbi:tRNA (adenosine(37)-N6)-dimethylallyltransferase MiaA [Benzoatithermus flavus]|uniref:tRNA dimethylallyltransferase n=1 Tax=Benzoatithermus flavus TaxID=3108223 RepID=A0ABU8XLE8_9PROT
MIDALVVIGGSTASGKSTLALAVARALDGVVVNADSQQLFQDLPILTARPTPADEAVVPHRLYGVLAADEQPSVGRWLTLVEPVLAACRAEGRPAIVTGGTGLYLHALLHGMPEMPEIPADLRSSLRAWAERIDGAALHERLAMRDPVMAARLRPSDTQRLLRALEVVEATGRSLAEWQEAPRRCIPLPERRLGIALLPPPAVVNPRIEARLEVMLKGGALEEVETLLQRRPDALRLPTAKIHGLRELAALLQGRLGLEEAKRSIAAQIRQYAKRQRTWFRHQLPELQSMAALGDSASLRQAILAMARERLA